jgi:ATP-dependent helicase/nuclease subunit A
MSAARSIPWQTKQDQWRASDPKLSAWVSAHAGSGKTHVLSQRVVRLLLARVPPSRILCLTYTKAAAANMAARIFDILAKWTLLDDDSLDNAVEKASGRRLDPAERDFARRLFARTVETPGGLKVQTIHAFCERILHLFPFEANVPAGFRIIDDIERGALLADARKETLDRALSEDDCLRDALATVARDASEATFDGLIGELLHHRGALRGVARGEDYERDLRRRLGLAEGETLADIEALMIDGGVASKDWPALAERLRQGSPNDVKLAARLAQASSLAPDPACIDEYLLVFFTQEGKPRGTGKTKLITKGLCEDDPNFLQLLEEERERLAALIDKRKTAATYARSLALARIGEAIVSCYERKKNHRGLFDFDDLIERTRELLRRSSPSWVLYKLDQRIDHILLDEAQDTSAPQWEILQVIANEFAQATRPRSFFAVGDEKQSIFSFQGAAPEKFDAMWRGFQGRFNAARLPFEHVRLTLSFRSAPTILASVDAIFSFGDNRLGLSFDPAEPAPEHTAWKNNAAGLVEIWDPIGPKKREESKDWKLPLDFLSVDDPAASLARKVAGKIASLLDLNNGEWVEGENGPRAIAPGDFLILVRKRDAFFEAMIRALKEQHIPVAGADRLDLMNHIAVMDLCALGRATLLPEDDLTLAIVLKSPLIGLGDDDLIEIAPKREDALIHALEQSKAAAHREAALRLNNWSRDARRLTPFDFYSRALGAGRGRERLVARLGPEANDAIDEFLRLALDFERDEPGSLTSFLAGVEKLDVSIKRDMEAAGDAVRVMTVHAAKGLEAKIVFLPDTCGAPTGRHDPKVFALTENEDADDASLVWSPKMDADPEPVARARDKLREAARNEHRRLLYVALTRAEERLYIAGFVGERGPADGCWHNMIREALEGGFDALPDQDEAERQILRSKNAPARIKLTRAAAPGERVEIPAWARTSAEHEAAPTPPLRPSSALTGADAAPDFIAAAPARRDGDRLLIGRLTHALLQHLPRCAPDRRPTVALRFLELHAPRLEPARSEALVRAVLDVIDRSSLAPLFGAGSAAEVDIVARIDTPRGPRDIVGRIDRIAETESEVFIADFKTGAPRVSPSLAQLRQLALYRAAALPLYPGKKVRCVLIFTQDASVVEPCEAALEQAFEAIDAF